MHSYRIIFNDILLMFSEQKETVGYKYLFDIILNKNSQKFIFVKIYVHILRTRCIMYTRFYKEYTYIILSK